MLKKIILLSLILLFFINTAKPQATTQHSVNLELGGNNLLYSFNYQFSYILNEKWKLNTSIGTGYFLYDLNYLNTVSLNYKFNPTHSLGLGFTNNTLIFDIDIYSALNLDYVYEFPRRNIYIDLSSILKKD